MILPLVGAPLEEIGGKAAGLARLVALGLPVPPAVVVPVSARGALDDPAGMIRTLGEPLAVRSSAVSEDASARSAAGQYETSTGVRRSGLAEAVMRVWRSAGSDRARAYADGSSFEGMAVVVQREIPATRSGIAFSRDPVTGEETVIVECVFGRGERVVSGLANPDRFWVGSDLGVRARLATKEPPFCTIRAMRDDEVLAMAGLMRRAEEGFGIPVDVEFCYERRAAWLVQCRPITTLPSPEGIA